jgi:hypothetical protein
LAVALDRLGQVLGELVVEAGAAGTAVHQPKIPAR